MATKGENAWQSDLNVCERNWYMFEKELETNVTFQVSSPQDGKILFLNNIKSLVICEGYPTSCSSQKVFPTKCQLAWRFWGNPF